MSHLAINDGPRVREKPFPKWPVFGDPEKKSILEVVESGQWGGIEERLVPTIEELFASFQDCTFGVSCTNGTHALEIALRAIGISHGDEVILSPYTFIASATSIILNNAIPIFVDIDADTLLIDPAKIEDAITPRTKAIMAVHIAGLPCDMDAINHIAKNHSIRVIEDCAQAHGAEWAGQRVGSIGDAGTFSFQSSKNLTSGEGGMIVTNNQEIFDRCWSIHNVGRVPGGRWYEHPNIGSNYRMTEWQAAILLAQLERLPDQMVIRDANAKYLREKLKQFHGIKTQVSSSKVTSHGYHLFIIRYESEAFGGATRNQFIRALAAEGVPCTSGYVPLYRESAFSSITGANVPDYASISLPVCENVSANEAVWLTQNILLGSRADMDMIIEAIAKLQRYKHELAESSL